MRFLFLWREQGEIFFVIHAVVTRNLLSYGIGKSQLDELSGFLYDGRNAVAPGDSGAQAGGEEVPGAGVAAAYIGEGEYFAGSFRGIEVTHAACACLVREPDAGDDDVFQPPSAQRLGEGAYFFQQVI